MVQLLVCLFFVVAVSSANVPAVREYFSTADAARMRSMFDRAIVERPDLQALYHGIDGVQLLKRSGLDKTASIPKPEEICKFVQSKLDQSDLSSVFHATQIAAELTNCKLTVDAKKLSDKITNDATAEELYHVLASLSKLKASFDNKKATDALLAVLKKDDSSSSLTHALLSTALLSGTAEALKPFTSRIEDLVAQADEIDGTYLQYDGGIYLTGQAVTAMLQLIEKHPSTAASLTAADAARFAATFVQRRGVHLVRPANAVLRALTGLAGSKVAPFSVTLAGPVALSTGEPSLRIRVCSVIGSDLSGKVDVVLDTAKHVASSGVVVNKEAMAKGRDAQVYEVAKFVTAQREHGFYRLKVTAAGANKQQTAQADLDVKIVTKASLSSVELEILDSDSQSMVASHKASPPNPISAKVEADHHQKVVMFFTLTDERTKKALTAHQAFVLFVNEKTKQETIFVAEPDADKKYKFDVNLAKSASDFNHASGQYTVKLIVGDAALVDSIEYKLGSIALKFASVEKPDSAPRSDAINYDLKPEIAHLFRVDEKRPSRVVSNAFTILCLVPLFFLLVLWAAIGINFSDFSFNLYTLGFHLGIGAIFALYVAFWLKLDMFETLKYLSALALFTFFCGNAMLRRKHEAAETAGKQKKDQ